MVPLKLPSHRILVRALRISFVVIPGSLCSCEVVKSNTPHEGAKKILCQVCLRSFETDSDEIMSISARKETASTRPSRGRLRGIVKLPDNGRAVDEAGRAFYKGKTREEIVEHARWLSRP